MKQKFARLSAPVLLVVLAALSGVSSVLAAPAHDLPSPTQIAEGAALVTSAQAAYPEFGVVQGIVLLGLVAVFAGLLIIGFARRGFRVGR